MSAIFGAPRGDLPKKRHGVRIGERKYSTIFTNFSLFRKLRHTQELRVSCL